MDCMPSGRSGQRADDNRGLEVHVGEGVRTRREVLAALGVGVAAASADVLGLGAVAGAQEGYTKAPWNMAEGRPKPADRRFRSEAVERFLVERGARIHDPDLRQLFTNCFPNTLDTTVEPGSFEGKPDTAVVTGDIAAMWLRDSSAQVWPYLPLIKGDAPLRQLLAGVIHRQVRCILIDPYANAFMADLSQPSMQWSRTDKTDMKQGVAERKWEVDSLCYPIRLAHGYWQISGDTTPFDDRWAEAMRTVLRTFREQQRKDGLGPYHFQRASPSPTETLGDDGHGNPVKPVGLIASGFRPSDDACIFPFLVPSNLFATVSLRQVAAIAHTVRKDEAMAQEATALATEVETALEQYAVVPAPGGAIWAYEVDGYGSQVLMDDANVPSLLGLPYLGAVAASPEAQARYTRTRAMVWSERNPYFFRGTAGEGIGGPHVGRDMIWPMSQIVYALTAVRPGVSQSISDKEIRASLASLKGAAQGFGFMHESYNRNDPKKFTRAWFAWANTLFGELVGELAGSRPELVS